MISLNMLNRTFEKKNLGQIKTVYPAAYVFRQEKGIKSYDNKVQQGDYQLTIEPVLKEHSGRLSTGSVTLENYNSLDVMYVVF